LGPIKLGIIGCGIAARDLHFPVLQSLKDKFKIVMVCNHTEQKAREFAEMAGGVPWTLDYKELLKNPEVEAVDITLPIHMNYETVKNAVRFKKHVIVEKPLAANIEEAKKLASIEKHYKGVLMVAENYRYSPLYLKAGEMIKEGLIGELYGAFWDIFRRMDPDNKYAKTRWRIEHQYEGGFITDAGIHNIAVLRTLCGDFSTGIAAIESINPGIGKMDSMSFLFATSHMVKGVLNIYYSVDGYREDKLLLIGTEGTIIVEDGSRITLKKEGDQDTVADFPESGGYLEEFEDFYKAVRGGGKVLSTFHEAYMDLTVMLGAIHSAEGKPVKA